MKVALGTFEIDEDDRKAIKRAMGFKGGKASRQEARDFLLAAARDKVDALHAPDPEELIAADEAAQESRGQE